jgi:tetratricopeptide (TPR) repeat protein
MAGRCFVTCAVLLLHMFCLFSRAWGEAGVLQVVVQDLQNHPVRGVEIGIEGGGGSRTSGDDGKALLPLSTNTAENDWVSLQIIHSPPGKDWVILSPIDSRTPVPSFKDKPENFVRVVVIQRGDLAMLRDRTALANLAAKINRANASHGAGAQARPKDPKAALEEVSQQYGLKPEELDQAIRAWGSQTRDPYEAGLAALYERNYSEATTELQEGLRARQARLKADQEAVADAAFFLGQSLYKQARYKESATAFQIALQIRPYDALLLNDTGVSLAYSGEYAAAEQLYLRALDIRERSPDLSHLSVAATLSNLAGLFAIQHRDAEAVQLFRRSLAINEKEREPNDPDTAENLRSLADLLTKNNNSVEAEQLYRRALAMDEREMGKAYPFPASPQLGGPLMIDLNQVKQTYLNVAMDLNGLGLILRAKEDYAGAEPLYRRSLAIYEKYLGPHDEIVASISNNLGAALLSKGDYAAAEALFERALEIDEQTSGRQSFGVASILTNLATAKDGMRKHEEAELLYRRAVAIWEKIGSDEPLAATTFANLAKLLYQKHDYTEAQTLYRRALVIDEKALGPDHPSTKKIRQALESLEESLRKQGEK